MRVLYVNHTSRISGAELSLLALLDALPSDIEPMVACPDGPLSRRVSERGIEVHRIRGTDGSLRLHPIRTPQALLEMAGATVQVRRIATATKADLIHANSIRAGLVATAAGRLGGPPVAVHVRDCLPEGGVTQATLQVITRADALIANSEYTRATLGRGAGDADVIYNSVDVEKFAEHEISKAEARTDLGVDGDGPVLAVIAQITPWKGQDDAISVASALRESHPGLRLLLVGSAKFDSASTRYDNRAYLASLEGQVDRLGLGDVVRFVGERDDIPRVLRGIDLLLVPSWEEPFGRSVIEAMASSVPVAATDVGGPPEILAAGGITLPPRSPDVWAREIDPLLADPAAMAQMGVRGQAEAASRFGLQTHADAVGAAYRRMLGETG